MTIFTRLSVHCADKRTDIKRVKLLVWSSGIGVVGLNLI